VRVSETRTTVAGVAHDRYYGFAELTTILQRLAKEHPDLLTLRSVGTSLQGREIWLAEITNRATGPGEAKPGYYLDAQIHAEEHATSSVVLYAICTLLEDHGSDPDVTRLLDEQVIYAFPRLNPDGAEFALHEPYVLWCGNGRCLPGEETAHGLRREDVDGDGTIVQMRVPDPTGEWRVSDEDPRLMVLREPGEEGGTYYRLYPEGRLLDGDGASVTIERPEDGNLNRNFPANWSPDEYGAGAYPLSEPETKAVADFLLGHPNVAGVMSYHTHGGLILRPSMTRPDAEMHPGDLALYQAIGEVGTRLTGYPTISIYEDFTPDKSKARHGGLMDWTYEQMGIVSLGVEVWDVETEAGVEKTAYYNLHPRDEATQRKVLDWVERHVGERGFRPWRPFDHPQLGPVEIGGLVYTWSYRNPPAHLLPDICRRQTEFVIRHAASAPKVRVDDVRVEPLGAGLVRVDAVVANHGYLPTNLTGVALDEGRAEPVRLRLETGPGVELVMNAEEPSVGHLAGRNERRFPWSPWGPAWRPTRARASWLVRVAGDAATVTVHALGGRAGRDARSVSLPAPDVHRAEGEEDP
jgi:murein tripeptide amidase MpaA